MAYLTESGVKKLLSEIKARLDKKMDSEAGHGTVVMVDTWTTELTTNNLGSLGDYWYDGYYNQLRVCSKASTAASGNTGGSTASYSVVVPSKYDLYVDTTNNKAYRWDGSKMVSVE